MKFLYYSDQADAWIKNWNCLLNGQLQNWLYQTTDHFPVSKTSCRFQIPSWTGRQVGFYVKLLLLFLKTDELKDTEHRAEWTEAGLLSIRTASGSLWHLTSGFLVLPRGLVGRAPPFRLAPAAEEHGCRGPGAAGRFLRVEEEEVSCSFRGHPAELGSSRLRQILWNEMIGGMFILSHAGSKNLHSLKNPHVFWTEPIVPIIDLIPATCITCGFFPAKKYRKLHVLY